MPRNQTNLIETHEIPSTDPRLDWAPAHDKRSLQYTIGEVVADQPLRSKFWIPGPVIDQGREGACVGFGWTGELMASPSPDRDADVAAANEAARLFYRACKQRDEWAGEDYDGTSVNAGAKVARELGVIGQWRWATTIDEVRNRVIAPADEGGGPLVIGIPWYEAMYSTEPNGFVNVDGELVGGHCLFINAFRPRMRFYFPGVGYQYHHNVYRWMNSWGPDYGLSGHGWITEDKLEGLAMNGWGEVCAPLTRSTVRVDVMLDQLRTLPPPGFA